MHFASRADKDGKIDEAKAEAYRRQIDKVRRELVGPRPNPIESILADRCALAWFDAYFYDYIASLAMETPGASLKDQEWLQRRAERADRRLRQSLKALADIRKVNVTAIQLNFLRQPKAESTVDAKYGRREVVSDK